MRKVLLPLATGVVVLGLWEIITRSGVVDARDFPPVTVVGAQLIGFLGAQSFWVQAGQTLAGYAVGLGIAIVIAIPAGLVIGSSELTYRATRPIIEFLRPVPSVALVPLAVLVYGVGFDSKVFLVAFASLWPILMQTLYGMTGTEPLVLETARAFQLGRLETMLRVRLPAATASIVTGVRISSAIALILAVTAEIVIGSPGIGHGIELARSGSNPASMYALIVVTGLLGLLLNAIMIGIEQRLLHWQPSRAVNR